jgi:hypothetical protein
MEGGKAGQAPTALAVRGSHIIAVGDDSDVRALADAKTQVVDAAGHTVVPGFMDAHTHFQVAAIQRHLYVDYSVSKPSNIEAVLAELRQRAAVTPAGEWIRGDGLLQLELDELRFPTRAELDQVAPDNPLIIVGRGHHSVAANSRALAIAGISRETPDPPGGEIERDENGEPNGVLSERGKLRLDPYHAQTVVPACSWEDRLESLRVAIAYAHAYGVTGIHDIVADPLEVTSYLDLKQRRELKFRVNMLIRGVGTETQVPLEYITGTGMRQGFGDDWVRFDGVKMSIDGSHTQRAAVVYDPYPGEPDNYGQVRISQEELDAAIATCHQHGLRAAVHAVGQRAVDMACDSFAKAFAAPGPLPGVRHRIEHAFLSPREGQLARIAELGLSVSTQPALVMNVNSYIQVYGEDLTGLLPLRSMKEAGIPLIFGTDFPAVTMNPFEGIAFAVTRRSLEGIVVDKTEALSVYDAVDMYTRMAAYSTSELDRKGTLTPGKLADLVVLDRKLGNTPDEELRQVATDTTVVDGQVVYQREQA